MRAAGAERIGASIRWCRRAGFDCIDESTFLVLPFAEISPRGKHFQGQMLWDPHECRRPQGWICTHRRRHFAIWFILLISTRNHFSTSHRDCI